MRFMLMMHLNPRLFESLTEAQRGEVYRGHEELIRIVTESGELVSTVALADPANTVTVRVRDGAAETVTGPHREDEEFVCGYYLVDCDSTERAVELAALIPDARYAPVEVRPLMHEGGPE
ncbi:YciI family protein [Nonomuraea sp. NPDC000554]|uniref:YciI family protein n=1 Tax=Nonomuraea sp. NPDC000554 TaxID=3154259 RepID=UPI00331E6D5F